MMTEVEYGATKIKIEQENEEKLKHYPILQKQLEIAQEALDYYSDVRKYNKSGWCSTDIGYKKAWEANLKIKELNK